MSNSFAIDSNVAVYAFSTDARRSVAMDLLKSGPRVSMQLMNEFVSVSLRKRRVPWAEIEQSLDLIDRLAVSVRDLSYDVHLGARSIAQRYQLSFHDALMLAAAMLDGCSTFYSEDMQDGMVIDGKMTIQNPFLEAA